MVALPTVTPPESFVMIVSDLLRGSSKENLLLELGASVINEEIGAYLSARKTNSAPNMTPVARGTKLNTP